MHCPILYYTVPVLPVLDWEVISFLHTHFLLGFLHYTKHVCIVYRHGPWDDSMKNIQTTQQRMVSQTSNMNILPAKNYTFFFVVDIYIIFQGSEQIGWFVSTLTIQTSSDISKRDTEVILLLGLLCLRNEAVDPQQYIGITISPLC